MTTEGGAAEEAPPPEVATSAVEKVEAGIVRIEKIVLGSLLAITFVLVCVQVVGRYFDLDIPDVAEASLVAIAMMTFLAIGLLTFTRDHISVDLNSLITSKTAKFVARQAAALGIFAFVAIFGFLALDLLRYALSSGEATVTMRIPMWLPFGTLVIGLVLAAFHSVMNVIRDVRVLRSEDLEFAEGEELEV